MTSHPKEKAEQMIKELGAQALAEAEKRYGVALEMLDLKDQGFWLDVIDRIKKH